MKNPLKGLFGKAVENAVPKTEAPKRSDSVMGKSTKRVVPYSFALSNETALKHPVIFRCVQKLATAVQTVTWIAEKDPNYKGSESVSEADISAINEMLMNPNPNMTAQQFRYWMTVNLALNGRALFKVGVNSISGLPHALYPLDSTKVDRTVDSWGNAKFYTYGVSTNKEVMKSKHSAGKKESYAFEVYTPSVTGDITNAVGTTPLTAMEMPAQVITLLMQRGIDTADGHPNSRYIITAERPLTEEQKKAVESFINEYVPGADESGKILFLYNTTVKVEILDNDLSDIHSKVPVDDMSRMIAGLFGIPVALMGLGAADGSKFAGNYVESRLTFWEDTIVPFYLNPGEAALTKALCPPGIRIRYLLDSIPALQAGRATLAKELSTVGFMTKNEKRHVLSLEKRPDGNDFDILNQLRTTTEDKTGKSNETKP